MTRPWRVMGMWDGGQQFLVVLGQSEADCRGRLREALEDYGPNEMDRLDSLWLEQWTWDEDNDRADWTPTELIPLRSFRLLRSMQRRSPALSGY